MAKRYGSQISVYTEVDVDVWEVITELSDDDIREEMERRKIEAKQPQDDRDREYFEGILEAIKAGKTGDAELMLERFLRPVFHSLEASEKAYKKAREVLQ